MQIAVKQSQTEATATLPALTAVDRSSLVLRSVDLDQWQDFVECHPDRTIFHHRHWIELIVQQYGLSQYLPALFAHGEIVAAAPFLKTRSLAGKCRYVSLPFTDSMRALLRDAELSDEFLAALQSDETLQKGRSVIMRTGNPLTRTPPESDAVRHEIDVSCSLQDVEVRFHKSLQRNIRRAERSNLRFEVSNDASFLDAFYRLHTLTRRKLGVPVQSRGFFRRIQENIISQGLGFVGLVFDGDAPIAGGVYLGYNQVLTAKYLASHPAALEVRPNEWLMYNMIQWSQQHEYSILNLGLCDRQQEGLRRFKKKWGARERDLCMERILGSEVVLGRDSRLVNLAGMLIRNSPLFVCRTLGELFYRFSY